MIRYLVIAAATALLSGCIVKTAGAVAGAGAKTAVAAGKTTTKTVAAVVPNGGHDEVDHERDPRPFDETRDAMADVDAAFLRAEDSGKNVLLILGGNWCHDSRGLAKKMMQPELEKLITENYETVWVDVGYRDRNLDVPARFGVPEIYGTPTVLILSPEGALLNRESVHDWRTADSKPYNETYAYFERFADADL